MFVERSKMLLNEICVSNDDFAFYVLFKDYIFARKPYLMSSKIMLC